MIFMFFRTLKATKRKSKTSPESPESLTPKIAKVKNDPIYDEEVDDQDFFDDYMDGGEEDNVTENDVGDKPGNEVGMINSTHLFIDLVSIPLPRGASSRK